MIWWHTFIRLNYYSSSLELESSSSSSSLDMLRIFGLIICLPKKVSGVGWQGLFTDDSDPLFFLFSGFGVEEENDASKVDSEGVVFLGFVFSGLDSSALFQWDTLSGLGLHVLGFVCVEVGFGHDYPTSRGGLVEEDLGENIFLEMNDEIAWCE